RIGLQRLGAAGLETRATGPGPKTELNPVFTYEDTGVRAEVVRMGAAETRTRADSEEGQLELIPVQRWEMGGAVR
nr:hypothetical protein [Brevundimonas sp.]